MTHSSYLSIRFSPSSPDISFAHHEDFARRLVEDAPSPRAMQRKRTRNVLTDSRAGHVLRSARSIGARSTRSFADSDTLRPPPADGQPNRSVLGEIAPNNQALKPYLGRLRPSPTPSLKKKKAEQILKEHGSPPELRVTAGGRIVPRDQSPLCSPRYGYSAINKNGGLIRFAPNYPPLSRSEISGPLPNGFIAQGPNGLCQLVDGQFLPIKEVDGIPQLYIAAPNVKTLSQGKAINGSSVTTPDVFGQPNYASRPDQACHARGETSAFSTPALTGPTIAIQIQALEKEYTKLEQEQKELDKIEVLQRSTMTGKAFSQLIQKRRELVRSLNEIRISLKALKEMRQTPDAPPIYAPEPSMSSQSFVPPPPGPAYMPRPPVPGWAYDGNAPDVMMPYVGFQVPREVPMFMGQPGAYPRYPAAFPAPAQPMPMPFNPFGFPLDVYAPHGTQTVAAPSDLPHAHPTNNVASTAGHSPHVKESSNGTLVSEVNSSPSRRTHAVEIKKPDVRSGSPHGQKSSLNPMSPSYQPKKPQLDSTSQVPSSPGANRIETPNFTQGLEDAVQMHNAWVEETNGANKCTESQSSTEGHNSSISSFATADFFPQNPREHSMNKQAYPVPQVVDQTSTETTKILKTPVPDEAPVTPEKECHNTSWNPTIPDHAFEQVTPPPGEEPGQIAPPGTPQTSATEEWQHGDDPVPNRSEMNLSPKSRRPTEFLTKYKSVSELATVDSSDRSPLNHVRQEEKTAMTYFSMNFDPVQKSDAFVEGFRAGLARLPVGPDKTGGYLDGYCAGLLKSGESRLEVADGSPVKQATRRPTPTPTARSRASSCCMQLDRRNEILPRPPPELGFSSFDTLKQAVFSPANENAILTPDPTAPPVTEMMSPNLGGWAKEKKEISNESTSTEAASLPATEPVQIPDFSRRVFSDQLQRSNTTQTSYLHRAYPGHRVLSANMDWKTPSSIAQVAGLATGYFAQFDGAQENPRQRSSESAQTLTGDLTGISSRPTSIMSAPTNAGVSPPKKTAFVEGLPDEGPNSPPKSPQASPGKKPTSPAKARFTQIAGKAGIKVRSFLASRPAPAPGT